MIKDETATCPHGWSGPWNSRPCGCKFIQLPWSEVCMSMNVAGTNMWVGPIPNSNAVQLYDLHGAKYSFPILDSEAGYTMSNENEGVQNDRS